MSLKHLSYQEVLKLLQKNSFELVNISNQVKDFQIKDFFQQRNTSNSEYSNRNDSSNNENHDVEENSNGIDKYKLQELGKKKITSLYANSNNKYVFDIKFKESNITINRVKEFNTNKDLLRAFDVLDNEYTIDILSFDYNNSNNVNDDFISVIKHISSLLKLRNNSNIITLIDYLCFKTYNNEYDSNNLISELNKLQNREHNNAEENQDNNNSIRNNITKIVVIILYEPINDINLKEILKNLNTQIISNNINNAISKETYNIKNFNELLVLTKHLVSAISAVHSINLVYLDIKPELIFQTVDNSFKLAFFFNTIKNNTWGINDQKLKLAFPIPEVILLSTDCNKQRNSNPSQSHNNLRESNNSLFDVSLKPITIKADVFALGYMIFRLLIGTDTDLDNLQKINSHDSKEIKNHNNHLDVQENSNLNNSSSSLKQKSCNKTFNFTCYDMDIMNKHEMKNKCLDKMFLAIRTIDSFNHNNMEDKFQNMYIKVLSLMLMENPNKRIDSLSLKTKIEMICEDAKINEAKLDFSVYSNINNNDFNDNKDTKYTKNVIKSKDVKEIQKTFTEEELELLNGTKKANKIINNGNASSIIKSEKLDVNNNTNSKHVNFSENNNRNNAEVKISKFNSYGEMSKVNNNNHNKDNHNINKMNNSNNNITINNNNNVSISFNNLNSSKKINNKSNANITNNVVNALSRIEYLDYDSPDDIDFELNKKFENRDKRSSFVDKLYDIATKVFKRHSTYFWVLKLTNEELETIPKLKYIKNLIIKAYSKPDKVYKFYEALGKRPLFCSSFVALKSIYVFNHYFFLINNTLYQYDKMLDFINSFYSCWKNESKRKSNEGEREISNNLTNNNNNNINNNKSSNNNNNNNNNNIITTTTNNKLSSFCCAKLNSNDAIDTLKNEYLTKFLVNYSAVIREKILFFKKYQTLNLDHNYSLQRALSPNYINRINIEDLLSTTFIKDVIGLYKIMINIIEDFPIHIFEITRVLDCLFQLLNEEICSIFNFLFMLLIPYISYIVNSDSNKNDNENKNNDEDLNIINSNFSGGINRLAMIELNFNNDANNNEIRECQAIVSKFIEYTDKALLYSFPKIKEFRNDYNSIYIMYSIPDNYVCVLKQTLLNISNLSNNDIDSSNMSRKNNKIKEILAYLKKSNNQTVYNYSNNTSIYPIKIHNSVENILIEDEEYKSYNFWNTRNTEGIGNICINSVFCHKFKKTIIPHNIDIMKCAKNNNDVFLNENNIEMIKNTSPTKLEMLNHNNNNNNSKCEARTDTKNNKSNNNYFIENLFKSTNNNKDAKNHYNEVFNKQPESTKNYLQYNSLNADFHYNNNTITNNNNSIYNRNYNYIFNKMTNLSNLNSNINVVNNKMTALNNNNNNTNNNLNALNSIFDNNKNNNISNLDLKKKNSNKTKGSNKASLFEDTFKSANDANDRRINLFDTNNYKDVKSKERSKDKTKTEINNINNLEKLDDLFDLFSARKQSDASEINNKTNVNIIKKKKEESRKRKISHFDMSNSTSANNKMSNINNLSNNNNNNNLKVDSSLKQKPTTVVFNHSNNKIFNSNSKSNKQLFKNEKSKSISPKKSKSKSKEKETNMSKQSYFTSLIDENKNINKYVAKIFIETISENQNNWLINSNDIILDKKIGFGGSSEVFLGLYRGSEVAVKKLRIMEMKDEETFKEFKREISTLSLIRHPNLVLFMGVIAETDNISIITEYCQGGTLFNLLHQRKEVFLEWNFKVRVLLDIAIGMNFLHTNNPTIIHRDLKSLNILLTEKIDKNGDTSRVKITDFGLSKILKKIDNNKIEMMTGMLGTCHWMAPEILENKKYSIKADVFSFGIIIWECVTRNTPYEGMSPQQISIFVTVKKGRPELTKIPNDAPNFLVQLMKLCWDDNPEDRPSFDEIITFLRQAIKKGLV